MVDSVEELAPGVAPEQREKLVSYAGLVKDVGARWNLMSRGALERVQEHIVDSAALLRVYDASPTEAADVGSGAGLPGVVLAILRPDWKVSLIDSRRSKAVFLREALRVLELRNARVIHERLERLPVAGFDLAVSRALGNMEKTLAASLRLIAPGGRLVLYKGPGWSEERRRALELADAEGAWGVCEDQVALPGLQKTTTFVSFKRYE